jgi:hypothetical protein
VHLFTRMITLLFDGLLLPFGSQRLLALLVMSALTGALLALLFKTTSDQQKIRRSRDRFKARVLEMRLYPDDIVLITRAFWGAIASQGTYLRVALKPILIVLVVAVPVFIQLEARFAHAPLSPGEQALVTATLKPGLDPTDTPATLTADHALAVEAAPLRVPATREIVWRMNVAERADAALTVRVLEKPYRFPVSTERNTRVIGRERAAHGVIDALIHPGLPPVPGDSPVASVRVSYPEDSYRLFGANMNWLVVFLIGSFVGAVLPAWILRIQL